MTKQFLTMYDIDQCPYADKKDRKIDNATVQLFQIKATINPSTGAQDAHFYPYYIKGVLSGYKSRVLPKDFTAIGSIGNIKGCDLFGQNTCQAGGFKILITEGEEDALAAHRMLYAYARSKGKDIKPNVVSLVNGASGAAAEIERALPFLSSFKEIIVCFDNDKAGKQALSSVAALLEVDKLKIMEFSEKDASDMLVKGKQQEFISAFFNAKTYRPDGIINIKDLWDRTPEGEDYKGVYYPKDWAITNDATFGKRLGDFDMYTAGTGNGKTQFFRELIYNDLMTTDYSVGVLSLEETVEETLDGITGLHINKRIHLPNIKKDLSTKEKKDIYTTLIESNRVEFYEHKGQAYETTVFAQIRHMAAVQGCKHIYVDHLGMLLGKLSAKNIYSRTDALMIGLRNIAQELKIWIGAAAHLRKTDNKGLAFERGGLPSADDLKGSGALKQIPNTVFVLQRNGEHEVEHMRDVMRIHILKSRFVGKRGGMDFLKFNQDTGRLNKISQPEYEIIEPPKKIKFKVDDGEF